MQGKAERQARREKRRLRREARAEKKAARELRKEERHERRGARQEARAERQEAGDTLFDRAVGTISKILGGDEDMTGADLLSTVDFQTAAEGLLAGDMALSDLDLQAALDALKSVADKDAEDDKKPAIFSKRWWKRLETWQKAALIGGAAVVGDQLLLKGRITNPILGINKGKPRK